MQNRIIFHIALFFICLAAVLDVNDASASGFLAGELSYTCTDPALQAYQFDLVLYADCQSATNRPNQIIMDYSSSCLNGDLNLVLSDSSIAVEPCQSATSCCNGSVAGCQQAIKRYHYKGSINNLPICGDWVFSASACCRSQLITNSSNAGNYRIYLEALLDNQTFAANSCPLTANQPWIMACEGEAVQWWPNASDPNSDSLVFELIDPEGDILGLPTPVPYAGSFSPNAPVSSSGSFLFDGLTGGLSFIPTAQSSGITSLLISEYRNGLMVGQSRKDIYIWVRQCVNSAPQIQSAQTNQSCIQLDSLSFGFCPNSGGQFNITFADPDLDTVLIEEQITNALPGAIVLNQNRNLDVSWTPGWQDTGEYFIPLRIKDDGCSYPRQKDLILQIRVGQVLEAGKDTATYCGQAVQLFVPLGSEWLWTPSAGLSSDTVFNPLANPVSPRWYTVSNSCGIDSLFVDVRGSDYTIDIGADYALCHGLSDTLEVGVSPAASSYQFTWLGNISGQSNERAFLSPSDQGKVIVEVADGRGCLLTDSLFVTRRTSTFNAQVQTQDNLCANSSNGSIQVSSGGLNPVFFQLDTGVLQGNGQFSNLPANSYVVRIVDSAQCDTSLRVQVSAPAPLSLSNIQIDSPDCYGFSDGELAVQAAGGVAPYQYNFNQQGFQLNTRFPNLSAGNYPLVYRDVNGCLDTQNIVLAQPDSLAISIQDIDSASCRGDGRLLLSVTGGSAPYQILLDAMTVQNGVYKDSLQAGTYNLSVMDDKGCLANKAVDIPALDSVSLSLLVSDVLCRGDGNGQIVATASGGFRPYSYSLNAQTIQSSNTFTGLNEGQYNVLVEDSFGCAATASVRVNEPAEIQLSSILTDAICHGQAVGSVQLSASGGTPAYTYTLLNSANDSSTYTTGQINQLYAGAYTLVLKDQNGCLFRDSFSIAQPPSSQYQRFVDSVSCYDLSDGAISVIGVPPSGFPVKLPFSYALNGGSFEPNGYFGNLRSGDYTLLAKDNQGCIDSLSFSVYGPPKLSVHFDPSTITLGQGESGILSPDISGVQNRGYLISWTPSIGLDCDDCPNPRVGIFESRSYRATITDRKTGCAVSDTIRVLIREPKPVFVPNVFTPNGDGVNDELFVYGNDIQQMHLRIFNRWGENVFETKSQSAGWSGIYKGSNVKNGVYQFYLVGTYLSGETFERSGNVTLIR